MSMSDEDGLIAYMNLWHVRHPPDTLEKSLMSMKTEKTLVWMLFAPVHVLTACSMLRSNN